jgi:hypothetical protein
MLVPAITKATRGSQQTFHHGVAQHNLAAMTRLLNRSGVGPNTPAFARREKRLLRVMWRRRGLTASLPRPNHDDLAFRRENIPTRFQ